VIKWCTYWLNLEPNSSSKYQLVRWDCPHL